MKILLLPGNNALSHAAKCLAIRETLERRGHEAVVAVSATRSPFLESMGVPHRVLPDLQESDRGPSPSFEWFKRPERFVDVVRAEAELLRDISPDRALGVFRFTAKAACRLSGVPFDALTCGCMLADCPDILGAREDSSARQRQSEYLSFFWGYCGQRANRALAALDLEPVRDVRDLLEGDNTFLWDFPEFMPAPAKPGRRHVGPLRFDAWPNRGIEPGAGEERGRVALLAFGTGRVPAPAVDKIARGLSRAGYDVVLAEGGQRDLRGPLDDICAERRYEFAPMDRLLSRADVVVCHGGQMTVFEALAARVPVLVAPFQPEQAHNGICLERLGVGALLVDPAPCRDGSRAYAAALDAVSEDDIASRVNALLSTPGLGERLDDASRILGRYRGADDIVDRWESL